MRGGSGPHEPAGPRFVTVPLAGPEIRVNGAHDRLRGTVPGYSTMGCGGAVRRILGVLMTAALAAGAGALVSTGSIGAGVDVLVPTLRIHKTVVGTSTTPFVVDVSCLTDGASDGLAPVSLPFLADGTPDTSGTVPVGWTSNAGDWLLEDIALIDDTCTVTEIDRGAATDVAYTCAYSEVSPTGDVGPTNGATTGCLDATSGPSARPAKVAFPETCASEITCGDIAAKVTVINTMPTITVGPTASVPGGPVTISGTGCFLEIVAGGVGAAAGTPGTVTGTIGFIPPLAFGPVTAAADGTWSTSVVVPAGTPAGTYAVHATCTLPANSNATAASGQVTALASGTFSYPNRSLTVAIAASPKFTG